tara:strand:- start:3055 stop:3489 length:435 start_codon:yes stop_codon:yes gene_type:complete
MRIRDIIHEDLGSAVASAVTGATSAMLNIFDVPPTKKMAAVNAMVDQWDKEWPKIVQKDPGAKKKYGLALQSWLQGIFKEDPSMEKYVDRVLDVSKTVKGGRPDAGYIKAVFAKIFDAQKKRSKSVGKKPYSAKPRVRARAATS